MCSENIALGIPLAWGLSEIFFYTGNPWVKVDYLHEVGPKIEKKVWNHHLDDYKMG